MDSEENNEPMSIERAIDILVANGYAKPKKKPQGLNMSEAKKKLTPTNKKPSEGMKRLQALFHGSSWTWKVYHMERYELIIQGKTKDEFYEELRYIEAFYLYQKLMRRTYQGPCLWKKGFDTFLNNYDDQLSRAKAFIDEHGWPKSIKKAMDEVIVYMEPDWDWRRVLELKYGKDERTWETLPNYIKKEIMEGGTSQSGRTSA